MLGLAPHTLMKSDSRTTEKGTRLPRPPVVAVMGHIDHGKSTLLDYIRKTNITEKEAGGITQRLGAYAVAVAHSKDGGGAHTITFLDTPGHEAFQGIRSRGAAAADIAILVVSGEDGVKPQTLEALECIKREKIPYIVAITKIDKPAADAARVKQSLAEHEIYVEGYGGDVPCIPLSSKTGEGVADLLEMILLLAELHAVGADPDAPAEGFIVEAHVEKARGVAATLIVKEGTLKKGAFIVAGEAFAPTRCFETLSGETAAEARAGEGARVIGWSKLPRVGASFRTAESKTRAEELARGADKKTETRKEKTQPDGGAESDKKTTVPLILKADTSGGLEALEAEALKQETEKVAIVIMHKGVGTISENDLKIASGSDAPLIVGFNVEVDPSARGIAERAGYTIATFDVIYKLVEWLTNTLKSRAPKERIEEKRGNARILKIFSAQKDKHIVGGKVLDGELSAGDEFRILRRETEIGKGKIRELQKFKEKIAHAAKDSEFGALVNSSAELMPQDRIETFAVVER